MFSPFSYWVSLLLVSVGLVPTDPGSGERVAPLPSEGLSPQSCFPDLDRGLSLAGSPDVVSDGLACLGTASGAEALDVVMATGAVAEESSSASVAVEESSPLLTGEHIALLLSFHIHIHLGAVDNELGAVSHFDLTAGGLDFDRDLLALALSLEAEISVSLALSLDTGHGAPGQILTDSALESLADSAGVVGVGVVVGQIRVDDSHGLNPLSLLGGLLPPVSIILHYGRLNVKNNFNFFIRQYAQIKRLAFVHFAMPKKL